VKGEASTYPPLLIDGGLLLSPQSWYKSACG
jgi:hypothetical protein